MASQRKTIDVAEITEIANRMLDYSPDTDKDGRNAIISLLGAILHRTGNYAGFCYTEKSGIDYSATPIHTTIKDDTRRRYHSAARVR